MNERANGVRSHVGLRPGQAMELHTERLLLRQWREEDLEPISALCADPAVMEFLSAKRDRGTTISRVEAWSSHLSEHGWGNWAIELKQTFEFMGFVGISNLDAGHPFFPGVELAWRLAKRHWGHGYATEGGHACLKVAFDTLGLPEVIATTALGNVRSSAVMVRLGMKGPESTFPHPGVPIDNPLRTHVLYRISRSQWQSRDA